MEFPITDLLDYEHSVAWICKHFHPKGLRCPNCEMPVKESREFRRTRKSGLLTYRCYNCGAAYNLYTNTEFEGYSWTPMQVVLFMRGICTGETYKSVVKLTFFKGASLEDPSHLFNQDGTIRRAIDIHEGEMFDEEAFKTLIRAAVKLNTSTSH